jgi:predicted Zn-dependent protease
MKNFVFSSVVRRTWVACCCVVLGGLAVQSQSWAQEGVDVGGNSVLTNLVPAGQIEQASAQQYAQLLRQAADKKALAPDTSAQLKRLRSIAQRLIPFAVAWNDRAKDWRWEVNLIGAQQVNAFCMPGGKIVFYTGILQTLQLTDDEVAMVMGHEMAHALREHARARVGETAVTNGVLNFASQMLGFGQLGQSLTQLGAQFLTLKFNRSDESEADLVGMELAARAGYNPRAGVSLWQKMAANNRAAPPQWLSTHPAGDARIREIEANLDKVMPLYERAPKPQPTPTPLPGSTPPAAPLPTTP